MLSDAAQARGVAGEAEASAEHLGLLEGLGGQLLAANAAREAGVVADHGAGSRLPADDLTLHDKGRVAFRGAVGRGGQLRWSAADHDHVEVLPALARFAHESVGELLIGGIDEHLPVDQNPHRQPVGGPSDLFEKLPPLVRIHGAARVRDAVASADIPGLVRAPRPLLAADAFYRGELRAVRLCPLPVEAGDALAELRSRARLRL